MSSTMMLLMMMLLTFETLVNFKVFVPEIIDSPKGRRLQFETVPVFVGKIKVLSV